MGKGYASAKNYQQYLNIYDTPSRNCVMSFIKEIELLGLC